MLPIGAELSADYGVLGAS